MMPIEIKLIKRSHIGKADLYCPFFVCDVCGGVISSSGNYEYKRTKKGHSYEPSSQIYYTHKKCSYILRTILPESDDELWGWDELKRFPMNLAMNFADPDFTMDSPLAIYLLAYGLHLSGFTGIDDNELNQPGLYFLFDEDNLVYIGQSNNIGHRLRNKHHIYTEDYKIRYSPVRRSDEREATEKALILLLSPSLNTVYNYLGENCL